MILRMYVVEENNNIKKFKWIIIILIIKLILSINIKIKNETQWLFTKISTNKLKNYLF